MIIVPLGYIGVPMMTADTDTNCDVFTMANAICNITHSNSEANQHMEENNSLVIKKEPFFYNLDVHWVCLADHVITGQ